MLKNIQLNRLDQKKEKLENQAKKMEALSNSKFLSCSVEDTVRLKISDVDRGRWDFRNVLIPVISMCTERLAVLESISPENKSLRHLADKQSHLGCQGYKKCNFKSKYMTNKWKYKVSGG